MQPKRLGKIAECTFAHGFDDVGGSTLVRQNDEADMWAKAADFGEANRLFSTVVFAQ